MPSKEAIKKYLRNPNHCLYCGEPNVDAGSMDFPDSQTMIQVVECAKCGRKWFDVYKLKTISKFCQLRFPPDE